MELSGVSLPGNLHAHQKTELCLGQTLTLQSVGACTWWKQAQQVYSCTVVDIRVSDHTVKVQYADGSCKRLLQSSLFQSLCM